MNPIVYIADSTAFPWLLRSKNSVRSKHEQVPIYVINVGLTVTQCCLLSDCSVITPAKAISDYTSQFEVRPDTHVTHATYYKLALSSLLPHEEHVLYLDCDTLILSDISELLSLQPEKLAVAVPDFDTPYCKQLCVRGYFNAGVMVMNLRFMRRSQAEKVFSTWYHKHKEVCRFNEQDVLNACYAVQGYQTFSTEYNTRPHEAQDETKVIHFIGPNKEEQLISLKQRKPDMLLP